MTTDNIFKKPYNLIFKSKDGNILNDSCIVVGVEHNGD